jgi:3-deoxy-D-manno-octulosonic-acid transferase
MPFFFHLYSWLSFLISPFIKVWVHYRLIKGLEEKNHLSERFGFPSIARPAGHLVWFHAASVGETLSLVTLLKLYKSQYPDHQLLLTTTTVTAARLAKERLKEICIHQYVPFDVNLWVIRFLKFWTPNLAILVESEWWPNLICQTKQSKIPLILLNARLSDKSYQRWLSVRLLAKSLLKKFAVCLVSSNEIEDRLTKLGAPSIKRCPHLKFAVEPLPVNLQKLKQLHSMILDRPIWVAASTHPGEEELILKAHQNLRTKFPNLLTVIIPRHPKRAKEIAQLCYKAGENEQTVCLYSQNLPKAETNIWVGDTIGELGLFFRLSHIVFVGKSLLLPGGGHNPIEPALLKCAVLYGPYMQNFREVCNILQDVTYKIDSIEELVTAVTLLLDEPELAQYKGKQAYLVVQSQTQSLKELVTFISKVSGTSRG